MKTPPTSMTLVVPKNRRSLLFALSAIVLLTSCLWLGGSRASATSKKRSTPATVTIPAGTVLNVGDQQQFLESTLDDSGALNGAPYKVNFVEFGSGPLVDAGFAAHQLDVGFMGDLPASLAVQSGLPVKAVIAMSPVGASEFLLAKPGITSIAQLKGQTVAYTTGTAEQAFALRALASAGLNQKDITQVNVALNQLGTVLQSGAAVASVVSIEQKAEYEQSNPGAVVLATQDTVKPASYDYMPVSYTHLDVYKRQHRQWTTHRELDQSSHPTGYSRELPLDHHQRRDHRLGQQACRRRRQSEQRRRKEDHRRSRARRLRRVHPRTQPRPHGIRPLVTRLGRHRVRHRYRRAQLDGQR